MPNAVGSTAELSNGGNDLNSDHELYISQQIQRVQHHVKWNEFGVSALGLLVGVLVFLLAVTMVDHWIVGLGIWARTIFFVALIVGVVGFAVVRLFPVFMKSVNPIFAAKSIEDTSHTTHNSLVNFLFLKSRKADVKPIVFQAVERRAAIDLAKVSVETAIDRTTFIRLGYALAALVVFAGLYKIVSPKDPLISVARIMAPWRDIARPSRVNIVGVEPGDTTIYRGESISVTATVEGVTSAEAVRLIFSSDDGQSVDREIEMIVERDGLTYRTELGADSGMQQTTVYRIVAGDAVSSDFTIEVSEAPHILVKRVEYDFPSYTGLENASQFDGDISALEGTKVTIVAYANQPIRSASVELFESNTIGDDSDSRETNPKIRALPMSSTDQEAQVSFTLALQPDRKTPAFDGYQLVFSNMHGDRNNEPVKHVIDVKPDLAPLVEILTPAERTIDVPENGSTEVEVRAVDPDFKLKQLTLEGISAGNKVLEAKLIDEPLAGQVVRKFTLRPKSLGLQNGDVAIVWASAEDNRETTVRNGFTANQSQTEKYRIRIVESVESNENPDATDNTKNDKQPPRSQADDENNEAGDDPQSKQRKSDEPGDSTESGDPSENGNQGGEESNDSSSDSNASEGKSDGSGDGQQAANDGNSSDQNQKSNSSESDSENEDKSDSSNSKSDATNSEHGSQGQSDQDQRPIESDGSDDGEAIERILDHMKESDKVPDDKSTESQEGPPDDAEGTAKDPKAQKDQKGADNSDNNAESDSQNNQNSKPSEEASKDHESKDDKGIGDNERSTEPKSSSDSNAARSENKDQANGDSGKSRKNNNPENNNPENNEKSTEPKSTNDGIKPKDGEHNNGEPNSDKSLGHEKDENKESKKSDSNADPENDSKSKSRDAATPDDSNPPNTESNDEAKDDSADSDSQQGPQEGDATQKQNNDSQGKQARDSENSTTKNENSDDSKSESPNDNSPPNKDPQKDYQQSDSKPTKKSNATDSPTGGNEPANPSNGESADSETADEQQADEANLDYAKKATNMALEHLRDQKDDRKLLEKLGWTAEEAESFLKRWSEMAKEADKPSIRGTETKREFDEALRGLGLRSPDQPTTRRNVTRRKDANPQATDSGRRSQPPASYQEQFRAYLKGIRKE